MPKETISSITVRSFLPTRTLVERRDIDALWLKFRSQIKDPPLDRSERRLRSLFDFHVVADGNEHDSLAVFEQIKFIGSFAIETASCPITAHSGVDGVRVGSSSTIALHMENLKGPEGLRADLSRASSYIQAHQQLRERPYILGATYSELGRLLARIGFRQMEEVQYISEQHLANIQACHQIFCALNNKTENTFTPVVMYLPREELFEAFPPTITNELPQCGVGDLPYAM